MPHSTYWELFAKKEEQFEVLLWPSNPLDINLIGHLLWHGTTNLVHGSSTTQFTGVKGSAGHVLVPDTTEHHKRSCSTHVSPDQSCFGGTQRQRSDIILGRWSNVLALQYMLPHSILNMQVYNNCTGNLSKLDFIHSDKLTWNLEETDFVTIIIDSRYLHLTVRSQRLAMLYSMLWQSLCG